MKYVYLVLIIIGLIGAMIMVSRDGEMATACIIIAGLAAISLPIKTSKDEEV